MRALLAAAAFAAAVPACAADRDTPSTLTGEWGGIRTALRDHGLDLTLGYGSQTAWNPAGGERERLREAGQFVLGATVDTEKLAGVRGGTFQATVTFRRGQDLGAAAGLHVLQQVQEVYGRGQTWRLTQFWYQQRFGDGPVDLKFGRLTQGEDFAAFSCDFMNLSFCGSPPGNLAGDYWYNWPISQWAARIRVRTDRFYAMAGVYEVNPRNLDNDFFLGHFHGATGVLLPAEIGFTPRLGPGGLPGAYRFGGWYNSADADDVLLDLHRQPRAITGAAPLRRDGRYGFYAQFQQQLTGTARQGRNGPEPAHGLSAFLNITQTDRNTTATDNQVAAGVFYLGLLPGRPQDDFGLAVARTNVNSRATLLMPAVFDAPQAEYAFEVHYGLRVTGWLLLRPNVQHVVNPGGYTSASDVVIVGMKGAISF